MAPGANTTAFPWVRVSGSYDAVIILYHFFDLTDDQRYGVFRRVVLPEGQRIREGCEISKRNFFELYTRRTEPKRPAWNRAADLDNPGQEEHEQRLATRAAMHEKLRQELKEMGIWNADMDLAWEHGQEIENGVSNIGVERHVATEGPQDVDTGKPGDNGGIEVEHNQNFIFANKESGRSLSLQHKQVDKGTHSKQLPMSSGMSRQNDSKQESRTANNPFDHVSSHPRSSQLHPPSTIDTFPDLTFAVPDHRNTATRPSQATSESVNISAVGSSHSDNPSSTMSIPLLTISKLNMIHQRDLTWHNGTPMVHRETYVSQDQTAFNRGGPVFRVSNNGQWEDVMICGGCYYCQNGKEQTDTHLPTKEELSSQVANSPTQGLPFVHSSDVNTGSTGSSPSSKFLGTARNLRPDYPAMMRTDVTFTRGTNVLNSVTTMQCISDTCKVCNPDTEMDDLLRSWQPGGEEYERDKVESLKYDQMRREYVASMNAEAEEKKTTKKAAMKSKVEAAEQTMAMDGSRKK
ncbi:hypothetical protein LTR86_009658 [Recurvomyces mirabilis]|nr:hypothetical protein LTR86_009658 [Recurvomyces mirabilis]